MVAKVQIKRTSTNDLPPTGLLPGELCVEMGVPTRLWVGVPTAIDSTGKKLLAAPTTGSFVLKSGDTMTGSLTISPAASSAQLALNKAAVAGSESSVIGLRGGFARWGLFLGDGTAESSGNAGSNFAINRYADNGAFIASALTIGRANGNMYVYGGIISAVSGNVGTIYFGSDLQHYLTFNGTDYTMQGTTSTVFNISGHLNAGGSVFCNALAATGGISSNIGYATKAGMSGAIGSNRFNFDWNGNLIAWVDNVNVGQVAIVCDYRIKQNVATLPSTWDKVKALNPIKYNYKANEQFMTKNDDIEHWGFLAHELQDTLVKDAASGVKDAENILQSPNPLVIIAALTKALQEAMLRIEALETAAAIR
jgi:Chaperone of endosialidase